MFSINSELLRNFLLDMNGKSYILYLQVNKCSARLKGPAGINPVSYTHLDVYKRQAGEESPVNERILGIWA